MGLVRVNAAGLHALASSCESWADEVVAASVPNSVGPRYQATADAVGVLHVVVGTAAESLGGALRSTAAKLTAASLGYSNTDEGSAADLNEMTRQV